LTAPIISPPVARPLSIGELLDRAVTLFVRNLWLFCGLAAVVYVPLAVVQSLMADFWLWYGGLMSTIFASGGKMPNLPPNAAMLQRLNAVSLIEVIVWLVAAPLASAALIHAAGRIVCGEPTSFREALRFAVLRWGSVLLFLLLWAFLVVAALVAGYVALLLLALLAAAVFHSVILAVILGIAVLLAWLLAILVAFVAGGVGFATLMVETGNALRAFAAGLERAINRASLWRSVVIGLVYGAIAMGFSSVAYAAGFALLFTLHTGIPMVIIASMTSLVQFGFGLLIMVLYYFDLRIRREGADLTTLASQIAAAPAP